METLQKIFKKLSRPSTTEEKVPDIHQVAIFGSAEVEPGTKVYQEAFEVAKVLAKTGYEVVDGGGPGIMKAATLGAHEGGGKVIGVTFRPENAPPHFRGRDISNPIDQEIQTTSYVERTLTLMREGQVYVVFNGASGTMSEFAMAWGLARIYFGHHKPLILYGKFWREIMSVLKKHLLLRPEERLVYKIVTTPEGVLRAIHEFKEEITHGKESYLTTNNGDIKHYSL